MGGRLGCAGELETRPLYVASPLGSSVGKHRAGTDRRPWVPRDRSVAWSSRPVALVHCQGHGEPASCKVGREAGAVSEGTEMAQSLFLGVDVARDHLDVAR